MSEEEKTNLIRKVKESGFRVVSEVGKKDPNQDTSLFITDRIDSVGHDLEAGAEKVILEARESGRYGIYDRTGLPAVELLKRLVEHFGVEDLIFEAPLLSQQTWMIRNFGPWVNLAKIGCLWGILKMCSSEHIVTYKKQYHYTRTALSCR